MKTHSKQPKNNTSALQAKAKNQAPEGSILQAYKKGTAQLQSLEEEEPVQGKFETAQLEELAEEDEEPAQLKENKTGLPDNLKSGVESISGHSMDDVKVHYNSAKPAELQAHAYAQGTDIHVAPGQEKHLPHEAWHVVQQKQGRVKPTKQLKGTTPVNDDTGLEKEADVMGAKAVQFAGNTNISSGDKKTTDSSYAIQRKQVDEADDYGNLGLRDTNQTFSVVGQFGKSGAKWYADKSSYQADDKAGAISEIAEVAGEIGENTQELGEKEIAKGVKAGEATGIYANKDHYNKSDVNAIDPFTHGSYCQIGDDKYIVIMYQHTHDLDGYVTGIEEGNIGEDGEFERTFAENMKYGKTKATASVANPRQSFSSVHDKTGGNVLNDIAGKGKADAITKLAGEGARFQWVRKNISTITDDTEYDEVPVIGDGPALSIRFADLWCVWKSWFEGAYNIDNTTINDVLQKKGYGKVVSEEAKRRILFDGKKYDEYINE